MERRKVLIAIFAALLCSAACGSGEETLDDNEGVCWPDMTDCESQCFEAIQDSYPITCAEAEEARMCRGQPCWDDVGIGASEWLVGCVDYCEVNACLEGIDSCQDQCLALATENAFEACEVLQETATCQSDGGCSPAASEYLTCVQTLCPTS
jgi:hypothetical protein